MAEEVSPEQFKYEALKQRVGQIVSDYEDELATYALKAKVLTQQRDNLQEQIDDMVAATNDKLEDEDG